MLWDFDRADVACVDFTSTSTVNPLGNLRRLAPGNSETYRNPARRKFAATSDDPDGGKRFPLLSVRSLRPASGNPGKLHFSRPCQPPVQLTQLHDSQVSKNENVQQVIAIKALAAC